MGLDRKGIIIVGVLAGLCLLGWFSPEIHKYLPRVAADLLQLALFLGLIALLGYAKLRGR